MNTKAVLIGVAIIVVAGGAYYFGVAQPKSAERAERQLSPTPGSYAAQQGSVDASGMQGTWKSTEDEKFTREFRADGTVVDRYEGDESATETGAYESVDPTSVEIPGLPTANLSGMAVIKVSWQNDPVPMFFSINSMTDAELAMTNLSGRGNILMFTRVR